MFYVRTNKIRYASQIAKRTQRQRLLKTIHTKGIAAAEERRVATLEANTRSGSPERLPSRSPSPEPKPRKRGRPKKTPNPGLDAMDKDPLPATSFTSHHHISSTYDHHVDLLKWLSDNNGDPALKVSSLRHHTCAI